MYSWGARECHLHVLCNFINFDQRVINFYNLSWGGCDFLWGKLIMIHCLWTMTVYNMWFSPSTTCGKYSQKMWNVWPAGDATRIFKVQNISLIHPLGTMNVSTKLLDYLSICLHRSNEQADRLTLTFIWNKALSFEFNRHYLAALRRVLGAVSSSPLSQLDYQQLRRKNRRASWSPSRLGMFIFSNRP